MFNLSLLLFLVAMPGLAKEKADIASGESIYSANGIGLMAIDKYWQLGEPIYRFANVRCKKMSDGTGDMKCRIAYVTLAEVTHALVRDHKVVDPAELKATTVSKEKAREIIHKACENLRMGRKLKRQKFDPLRAARLEESLKYNQRYCECRNRGDDCVRKVMVEHDSNEVEWNSCQVGADSEEFGQVKWNGQELVGRVYEGSGACAPYDEIRLSGSNLKKDGKIESLTRVRSDLGKCNKVVKPEIKKFQRSELSYGNLKCTTIGPSFGLGSHEPYGSQ